MKRRHLLFSACICGVLLSAGWQTPQTILAQSRKPLLPMGKAIPFKEAVARTDLKHLNKTLRTAQGAVLAFYAALKSNRRLLRQIVSPDKQRHWAKLEAEGIGTWGNWLEGWSKNSESIIAIGEPTAPFNTNSDGAKVVFVPITRKIRGEVTQSRIRVAQYGENSWLWDEN